MVRRRQRYGAWAGLGFLVLIAGCVALWHRVTSSASPPDQQPIRDPAQAHANDPHDPATDASPAENSAAATANFAAQLATADLLPESIHRKLQRAGILATWIAQDFPAAFRYLREHGFADLSVPELAAMVAARASVEELILVANHATRTTDALLALGPHLSPSRTAELAAATSRIDPARRRDAAGVLSGLLAARNLDAALRFAAGLAGTPAEAAAYAGIIDQLAGTNDAAEAEALWNALPPAVQADDAVLFARGNAVRNTDPATALASLAAIEDPPTRLLALVTFARRVEARFPGAAVEAIVNSGLSSTGIDNHVTRILRTWVALDPDAARDYVETAPWISDTQRTNWQPLVEPPAAPANPP